MYERNGLRVEPEGVREEAVNVRAPRPQIDGVAYERMDHHDPSRPSQSTAGALRSAGMLRWPVDRQSSQDNPATIRASQQGHVARGSKAHRRPTAGLPSYR